MASAVNPITASDPTSSSSAASATGLGAAPSEDEFLQLLVAQLQNQDPMNPTDSTQFVSELAQFSELEQVIGIRGDIESYHSEAQTAAAAAAASSTTNSNSGTSNTNGTGSNSNTNPTTSSNEI
jgi:flagellar basal-body rod modification protein FlgD